MQTFLKMMYNYYYLILKYPSDKQHIKNNIVYFFNIWINFFENEPEDVKNEQY